MTIIVNFTIIPAFSLLPLMVKEFFGGNAIHLSWVQSAMGIGIFSGGALLGISGWFQAQDLYVIGRLVRFGHRHIDRSIGSFKCIAYGHHRCSHCRYYDFDDYGPFFAIIQSSVEPEMQARVFALMSSVCTAIVLVGSDDCRSNIRSIWHSKLVLAGWDFVHCDGRCGIFYSGSVNIEEKDEVTRNPTGTIVMELKKA